GQGEAQDGERADHDREGPARRVAQHVGGDLCAGEDAEGGGRPSRAGPGEDHEGSRGGERHRESGAGGRVPQPGGDAEADPARERDRHQAGEAAGSREVVRGADRVSSFVLVLFALLAVNEARKLRPGPLTNPGPGFVPVCLAVALALVALLLLWRALREPATPAPSA